MRFATPVVNNPWDLFIYVNEISQGWFGSGIAIIVLFISLIYMGQRYGKGGILASFTIGTIVAILLRAGGIIEDVVMSLFMIATITVYFVLWLKK